MRPLLVILLDAFGNLISSTGSTPNNYLFAGEQFDPALGFYYMRARYYRPATGRFWTTDPIEGRSCCGMSWNPYIYALENAVNSTDPTGRNSEEEYEVLTPGEILRAAAGSVRVVCLTQSVTLAFLEVPYAIATGKFFTRATFPKAVIVPCAVVAGVGGVLGRVFAP